MFSHTHSGIQEPADHSGDNPFLGKTYERYVFNTRKQKARETVDDYVAALCTLASTCNFCDCLKDSLLRDRIVLGIKDNSTRKRLLKEANLNLETCIAMCRTAEVTKITSPTRAAKTVARRSERIASPDQLEISEVNFKTEMDDSDDSVLYWTGEQESAGFSWNTTAEPNKLSQQWCLEDNFDAAPQPISDNTSGPLLSLSNSHVCYLCCASFVLVSSLDLHLASVHGEKLHVVLPGSSASDNFNSAGVDNEAGKGKKTRKKKVGGKSAGGKEDRKKEKGNHECDVCGKSFPLPSRLKTHRLIHNDVKPYVCDVCGKSFSYVGKLTIHKRSHTGERPFKCPHCDSGFKSAGHLHCHIKSVHEGARPHLCDICGAAFSRTSDLTAHRRTHTGEKPFVCPVCGKGFANSSNLTTHRLTHTDEKPHLCPDCGKGFIESGNLAKHRLIHTGEKPQCCPLCPAAFRWPQQLKTHLHSEHQYTSALHYK